MKRCRITLGSAKSDFSTILNSNIYSTTNF